MTFDLLHHERTALGALRVHADCDEVKRCYELESDDGEVWRVVGWWTDDCRAEPGALLPAEEWIEVTRWAECSPQVDALWQAHEQRERDSAACEW